MPEAQADILKLKKSGNKQILKKLHSLIEELKEHPTAGTGQPEQLKNNFSGYWSRRINDKHRLLYRIDNDIISVYISQCYGHYNDK